MQCCVVAPGRRSARGRSWSWTGLSTGCREMVVLLVGFRREGERGAVHAITQPGRPGSIREDVAEMGVAGGAKHLGAAREPRAVLVLIPRIPGERRPEARPTRSGIEFRLGGEQRRAAAHAGIGAGMLFVPIGPGEGPLGAVLARDVILLRREQPAPFGLGFFDFRSAGGRRRHRALSDWGWPCGG